MFFDGQQSIPNRFEPTINRFKPILNRFKPILNRLKPTVHYLQPDKEHDQDRQYSSNKSTEHNPVFSFHFVPRSHKLSTYLLYE